MSRKKKTKTKTKTQFCVRTLKFYQIKDNERNYSNHEIYLQELVDKDNATGNKRREDPEIRLIKALLPKSGKKMKFIQQLIREFPVQLQKIHHIQLSGAQQGSLKEISFTVMNELFNDTTSMLIEANNEAYAKLVIKLTEAYKNLTWREVRRTGEAMTKEERLETFLARELKRLL